MLPVILLFLLQRIAEVEEQRRLKEQQEQQKQQQEREARAAEIFEGMAPAPAAANDDAVHADVERLLKQVPGNPGAVGDPMDVDGVPGRQQDEDGSDDGPADGGGFD